MAKCPHCKNHILGYKWANVDIEPPTRGAKKLPGFEISCLFCDTVISVSINPDYLAELVASRVK